MSVEKVKSWMRFLGWRDGGAPGSVKLDADGRRVAAHGDKIWEADIEHSRRQIRDAAWREEVERRNRLRQASGHSIYRR